MSKQANQPQQGNRILWTTTWDEYAEIMGKKKIKPVDEESKVFQIIYYCLSDGTPKMFKEIKHCAEQVEHYIKELIEDKTNG